jgi:hypothetical protein
MSALEIVVVGIFTLSMIAMSLLAALVMFGLLVGVVT